MIGKTFHIKSFETQFTKHNIGKLEKILQKRYNLLKDEKKVYGKYQYSRLLYSEKIRLTTQISVPNEYNLIEISFIISCYDENTTNDVLGYLKQLKDLL